MEKIIKSVLVIISFLAFTFSIAPNFEDARVLASGISFPVSQLSISEPLGLLILGVGIIGLARIGRKRFLKA